MRSVELVLWDLGAPLPVCWLRQTSSDVRSGHLFFQQSKKDMWNSWTLRKVCTTNSERPMPWTTLRWVYLCAWICTIYCWDWYDSVVKRARGECLFMVQVDGFLNLTLHLREIVAAKLNPPPPLQPSITLWCVRSTWICGLEQLFCTVSSRGIGWYLCAVNRSESTLPAHVLCAQEASCTPDWSYTEVLRQVSPLCSRGFCTNYVVPLSDTHMLIDFYSSTDSCALSDRQRVLAVWLVGFIQPVSSVGNEWSEVVVYWDIWQIRLTYLLLL